MADITGTFYGETSNDRIESGITWSETVDVAANNGDVTATLYLHTFTGYKTYSGDSKFSITINGTKFTTPTKYIEIGPSEAWVECASFTLSNIPHNADGTKQITISASGSMGGTSVTSITCFQTVGLYSIPRASAITAPLTTTNISVNGTNAVTVTLARKVSTYTHTVRIFLGTSYATATYKQQFTGVATSVSFAIPETWRKAMPSGTSMTANIEVDTFSGTTKIGSTVPGAFIISVPSTIAPTVNATNAPIAPVQPTATAGFTSYVQGYSRAGVTFVAGSWDTYESPITGYYIQVGGNKTDKAPYQTAVLNTAGTVPITVGVIDARGRMGTYTVGINVFSYSKPTLIINPENVYRSDNLGVKSETGAYIRISLSSLYSSVNGENSIVYLRGRYKATSGSSYGAWNNLNDGAVTIIGGALLSTTSYDLEIQVQDELANYTPYNFIIPTVLVPINFKAGNLGVAFGKYAEADNLLDSAWPIKAPSAQFTGNVGGGTGSFGSVALITPLGYEFGGTNAFSRVGAANGICGLGTDPIDAAGDTPAAWTAKGFGLAWYNSPGTLSSKPTPYGFLLNMPITNTSGAEVHQIWLAQTGGNVYHRGGNVSGWASEFKKLYDDSMISTLKTDLGIADPVTTTTPAASSILGGTIAIFRLYKVGKVVTFNMQYSAITTVAGSNAEAAVIPTAYRPADGYVALSAYYTGNNVVVQAYVSSAGTLAIRVESPITNLVLSGSWITA